MVNRSTPDVSRPRPISASLLPPKERPPPDALPAPACSPLGTTTYSPPGVVRSLHGRQAAESRRRPHQTREELKRVASRLRDRLARETCGSGRREVASEDLAESRLAVDWPTPGLQKIGRKRRGSGRKDDLAGPPLPPVRGVATSAAAQDNYDHSGR